MILSDTWIRQQCEQPRYALIENSITKRVLGYFHDADTALQKYLVSRFNAGKLPSSHFEPYVRFCDDTELKNWKPMIAPFHPEAVRKDEQGNGIISKGLSSYGYDITLERQFKVFNNLNPTMIDPKEFNPDCYRSVTDDHCVIPPNSFALGHTVEHFNIPRSVLAICVGKSTIARAGASVTITPLEPEWSGNLTLEIANTTNLPMTIPAHEGIAQLLFYRSDTDCAVSYSDRSGKYQNQKAEPTDPKV